MLKRHLQTKMRGNRARHVS